jgi:UDP-N-acetylmuramoylalanine--D-glutamate ligase
VVFWKVLDKKVESQIFKMEIKDLQEKLVAVLGFGVEGKTTVSYLLKHGVKPTLFDEKPWEEWDEIEKLEIKKLGINFIFGPDAFLELAGFGFVFRSPGISLLKVKGQLSKAAILTSQTKWFFEHCPAKIIGVTGTKGKGTTCSLIYEMLNCSAPIYRQLGKQPINGHATLGKPYLTGNIGKIQPLEILDGLTADDWVVYELSSFQLQDLEKSPHIGVVLMVTSEHLDYHHNQQEYLEAKSAITKFQTADDFAVINADFENSVKIGAQGKGEKIYFSRVKSVKEGFFVRDDRVLSSDSNFQFPISNLQLKGAHNLENVCASVSVGKILNIDNNIIRDALINFKGLEHRLEFVAEKNGIKFYNDSFSTTPETAIAAIQSFDEPEILILGGSSKNSEFTELGKTINGTKNVKAVILIGEEGLKIKLAIDKTLTPNPSSIRLRQGYVGQGGRGETFKILVGAKNMAEIFNQIRTVAEKGDVVLLSPACASFDMFSSYVDRGNQFKQAAANF